MIVYDISDIYCEFEKKKNNFLIKIYLIQYFKSICNFINLLENNLMIFIIRYFIA